MTEGSTACVNVPGNAKVGTVGPPLPGIKVKLAEQDEILIRGPTIMKGYYRNPEATNFAIDEEGWLHTGDKGHFDSDGHLSIVGRLKEQFKLSSGEYLVPSRIEYLLNQHPLVDMSMAIGEKRKYAACLLFPDFSSIKALKGELGIESLSDEEFLETEQVQEQMQELLESVNERINKWERLVKWKFILETPSLENGALTPSLKLRRGKILEEHKDLVNAIYDGEEKL